MKKVIILTIIICFSSALHAQKLLSWDEAPWSITAGFSLSSTIGGERWDSHDISGAVIDCTLKKLYMAVGFERYGEYAYVYDNFDTEPFHNVRGKICARYYKLKCGYSLPLGFDRNRTHINISPYLATGLMHLRPRQFNVRRLGGGIDPNNFLTMGPGVKVQVGVGPFAFGCGYEYQFFTNSVAPDGLSTFTASFGLQFK